MIFLLSLILPMHFVILHFLVLMLIILLLIFFLLHPTKNTIFFFKFIYYSFDLLESILVVIFDNLLPVHLSWNSIVLIISYENKIRWKIFFFLSQLIFTCIVLIHVLPFVNHHQVYSKVSPYILDTEDDRMYVVRRENRIIFHISIIERK